MTKTSDNKTKKFLEEWINRGNDNHSNKTKEFIEDWIENDADEINIWNYCTKEGGTIITKSDLIAKSPN